MYVYCEEWEREEKRKRILCVCFFKTGTNCLFLCAKFQYYFGDMNLMRDKFLKEKMQEDDGCIL